MESPASSPSFRRIIIGGLLVLVVFCFLLNITFGSVAIPLEEVARILFRGESDHTAWLFIVQKIRLPKAITAVLVGCGLSVSGLQMQ